MTAQEQFEAFHAKNPEVYTELVKLAREVKKSGLTKFSIKELYGRLRWFYQFETKDENSRFKLDDRYYSRYARLIMATEEDLRGFFRTRNLRRRYRHVAVEEAAA